MLPMVLQKQIASFLSHCEKCCVEPRLLCKCGYFACKLCAIACTYCGQLVCEDCSESGRLVWCEKTKCKSYSCLDCECRIQKCDDCGEKVCEECCEDNFETVTCTECIHISNEIQYATYLEEEAAMADFYDWAFQSHLHDRENYEQD